MGHEDAWRRTVPSPLAPAGSLAGPSVGAPGLERAVAAGGAPSADPDAPLSAAASPSAPTRVPVVGDE
eukprot:9672420-Alexandrium_andersonii.AAC.1